MLKNHPSSYPQLEFNTGVTLLETGDSLSSDRISELAKDVVSNAKSNPFHAAPKFIMQVNADSKTENRATVGRPGSLAPAAVAPAAVALAAVAPAAVVVHCQARVVASNNSILSLTEVEESASVKVGTKRLIVEHPGYVNMDAGYSSTRRRVKKQRNL